jgi:L-lactate dehydrogenase complex protein LldG
MSDARTEILARVRAAGAGATAPIPREYNRHDPRTAEQLVALFCERVDDYRAEVERVSADRVAEAIGAAAARHRATRLAVPAGLPREWVAGTSLELLPDTDLTARQLDALDGIISGCTVAIAETGTIALWGAAHEGRRLLSLVPDLHICVVQESQIVGLLPEALERLHDAVHAERRPVTLISGPSATSDIELARVEGVHGPRTLVVLVTSEESA